ncbi:EamA family transporter [Clostridium hydrogeniformans]|uniref:EamA family transporter n=1 Tax=Clostridium hydrogeniformans TaxID=349933 RepID=UPI0004817E70|nr:EamA family transporter [Clostridium hydrogeniformans]
MESWLLYALLSAVMAALVGIFGKLGLKGIDSNTATAIRAVIMAVFLMVVVFAQGKFNEISTVLANKKAMSFVILSGVAGALSWLFYFLALKNGKVSQVAPVDKLSVVFGIILAFIFLGERLSKGGILGAIFISVGVLLMAIYS